MESKKDLDDGSERTTGVMGILAESRRKAREAADQMLKEIEEETYLNKLRLIGELLEEKFSKIQRLAEVLENDWLRDSANKLLQFQERCERVLLKSTAWANDLAGKVEEIGKWKNWSPSAEESKGQLPGEPSKLILSSLLPEVIDYKPLGSLLGFNDLSPGFNRAEDQVAKPLNRVNNSGKEETRIEMDGLKEEIKIIKINEDKIMQLVQDLREQRKGSDTASAESKPRSRAMAEDLVEDEIMTAVKKGFELI